MIQKYRAWSKYTLEVQAFQWTDNGDDNETDLMQLTNRTFMIMSDHSVKFKNTAGDDLVAQSGDWIVKAPTGSILVRSDEVFHSIYKLAEA